jgi:hypothetical protein
MTNPIPPFPHLGPPGGYEAPNGMESVLPGMPDDVGSRDPSATTVGGAVSNAMAQMREMQSDTLLGEGMYMGDPIDLPSRGY